MSTPFANSTIISRPPWASVSTINGGFSLVNIIGSIVEEEVGYGEGGYGEGGYDAPGVFTPGASIPNWSVVATK